jgi:hypothetical protein
MPWRMLAFRLLKTCVALVWTTAAALDTCSSAIAGPHDPLDIHGVDA